MGLEVAIWPHTFSPLACALAGLVAQIDPGLMQVHTVGVLDNSISH